MTALVWLLTLVVVVLAVLVVGLLRSHATILRALHGAGIDLDPDGHETAGATRGSATRSPDDAPDIRTMEGVPTPGGVSGQRATDIAGTTAAGATRTVTVTSGTPTLLAFLTAGCTTCAAFWDVFRTSDPADLGLPPDVRLVIVAKGPEAESPADIAALAPNGIVTIQSSQAWNDYRIPVAPYFALVDGGRGVVIGEGAAASWDRVRDLLHRSLADAGLAAGRGDATVVGRRELLGGGRRRAARVDEALDRAGIEPGDPRLYHRTDPPPSEPSADAPGTDA